MTSSGTVLACVADLDESLVRASLPLELTIEHVGVKQLEDALSRADSVAAIVDRSLIGTSVSQRFLSLACCGTPWPVVEILRRRATNEGKPAWVARDLQPHELRARLWFVLREHVITWRLAARADDVDRRMRHSDVLCDALYVALLTPRPCLTRTELARQSGRPEGAIQAAFDAAFGSVEGFTLKDFLHRIAFLRGLAAHTGAAGSSERAIASRLHVSRPALDDIASDFTGSGMHKAAAVRTLRPLHEFEETMRRAFAAARRH